tara:strand:- start:41 stop:829 length:789 start_codon:yes stop_codon:yes gene_type:complete
MNDLGLGIDPISLFEKECIEETQKQSEDNVLKKLSNKWLNHSWKNKYTYHFSWLGRPIIQMPQDILAIQEIIWDVKPDLIIETGIAHGGSVCLSASILALLEIEDYKKNPKSKPNRKVIGIDIDIRKHNKEKIEKHFLADKITMIEASSIDIATFKKVEKLSKNYSNILVILDSNHTEEHVLQELMLYSSLVSKNSYCIVFDTIISEMAPGFSSNRPWNKKNSPKTAIEKFLKKDDKFKVDNSIDNKLLISMAPGGFLKKIK